MKSSIIFMSSLIATVQCMENREENFKTYPYQGTFYQMAAKAPCFLTYTESEPQVENQYLPLKTVNWYRYTINSKENASNKVLCFSLQYLLDNKEQDRLALNSALSASGRYAAVATRDNMYIVNIDKGVKIPVENYEYVNSVQGFCADEYLIQDSCKDEKNVINIWSIDGKKRASIPNLRLAGSYISALGYCMLHDQKQFIAWHTIDEKLQRNFLINCADGQVVKQWKSRFYDVVIHERSQIIAGDSDENTIDICSLKEIRNEFPQKLQSIVIPDKDDLIRCWCFNGEGDVLIIGTDKGKLYIANWLQNSMRSLSINQTIDDQDQITSINTVWMPLANVCCFDYGFSSVYYFDVKEVITAEVAPTLVPLHLSNNNNSDYE